jgi:hypothetical protein
MRRFDWQTIGLLLICQRKGSSSIGRTDFNRLLRTELGRTIGDRMEWDRICQQDDCELGGDSESCR